jgi:uncharacterized protein (TIGR02996 family)
MTNHERSFLTILRKNPWDDVTRLVYADWLDEHDDPRGEYLRLVCELGSLAGDAEQRQAVIQRLYELV